MGGGTEGRFNEGEPKPPPNAAGGSGTLLATPELELGPLPLPPRGL